MRRVDRLILDSTLEVLEEEGALPGVPATVQVLADAHGLTPEGVCERWRWSGTMEEDEERRDLLFANALDATLFLDEKLSDETARKWLDPNKSVLISNVWWTIKSRDLDKNKVTLSLSTWAKADGVKSKPDKTMPFTSLVKAINAGKIGVRIQGTQHGPAQDAKKRDAVRQRAGLSAAPGAAKFREDAMVTAERVGAYSPDILADRVEEALADGTFGEAPVLYRGRPATGNAANFIRVFGEPPGKTLQERLSWVASRTDRAYRLLAETLAALRHAGLDTGAAMIETLGFAYRSATGTADLDEVENRSDALLQFVMHHRGDMNEFEAWLRDNYPDLAETPEPLYERRPVQMYTVPNAIRESLRSLKVEGAEAVHWQNLVLGTLNHEQLERLVFEGVRGGIASLGDEALRWSIDAYTRVEEARRAPSREKLREQQAEKAIPIPRSVRARVRKGLMYHRHLGVSVTEHELRMARRLNRCSIPYADVARLRAREHAEVVDEDGVPDEDTVRFWMRGGKAGVLWSRKVVREQEG